MELIESDYTLRLTRRELVSLSKALNELKTLQEKLPDERNGYDLASQGYVGTLRDRIESVLG